MAAWQKFLAGSAAAITACAAVYVVLNWDELRSNRVEPTEFDGAADLLADIADLSDESAFERPSGSWRLSLPADHGGHPEARTETWMIVAHLEDQDGASIGVSFSLSRFGLTRPARDAPAPTWEITALHRAHATLAGRDGTLAEERFGRGAGASGHDREAAEVWLDNWRIGYADTGETSGIVLSASVGDAPLRLVLTPEKPALQIGGDGEAPVRGFTMSRMRAEGAIGRGETATEVSGTAWLDRLWGELPLPGGPLAYDRLLLHLDDGTDLSIVRTRRRDGRGTATVEGMVVDATGRATPVEDGAITMTPATDRDPIGNRTERQAEWRIAGADLDLRISPITSDEVAGFAVPGWIGTVTAEGRNGPAEVRGYGTLQLGGDERS